MRNIHAWLSMIILSIILLSFTFPGTPPQPPEEVPYPTGYRNWTHVKSKVIMPGHPGFKTSGGYHHIYANALTLEGYKNGKFPEGSIIVSDFIDIVDSSASLFEGKRKYIDVMVKDTSQYKTTGGWGYEEFDKDSKTLRRVTLVNSEKHVLIAIKVRLKMTLYLASTESSYG